MQILKNKKYVFISVLQILLVLTIIILDKLSKTRMGVSRHMSFVNSKIPEFLMQYAPFIMMGIIFFIAIAIMKIQQEKILKLISKIVLAISIGYSYGVDVNKTKVYYCALIAIFIINVLELLKTVMTKDEVI